MFLLTVGTFTSNILNAQCNGHSELCDKRYDEVAYVTTHNAYNSEEEGLQFPNHTLGIAQQLNDGVRGFMLDVYEDGGEVIQYHSFAALGTVPLLDDLQVIKNFMESNPNEVVTIIFESNVSAALLDTAFHQAGMIGMLHVQNAVGPWPTLQEMIDSGERLVVFSDQDDATEDQPWLHHVWNHAVETDFSNNSPGDLDCDFNRGEPENGLFILNHFVTDATFGVGQPDQAEIINAFDFFYPRALDCWSEQDKFPNFLTIDFHERGEPFRVADSLNLSSTTISVMEHENLIENVRSINDMRVLQLDRILTDAEFFLFDASGRVVMQRAFTGDRLSVSLGKIRSGMYILRLVENGIPIGHHRFVK